MTDPLADEEKLAQLYIALPPWQRAVLAIRTMKKVGTYQEGMKARELTRDEANLIDPDDYAEVILMARGDVTREGLRHRASERGYVTRQQHVTAAMKGLLDSTPTRRLPMRITLTIRAIGNGFLVDTGANDSIRSYDAAPTEQFFGGFDDVKAALPAIAEQARLDFDARMLRYQSEQASAQYDKSFMHDSPAVAVDMRTEAPADAYNRSIMPENAPEEVDEDPKSA